MKKMIPSMQKSILNYTQSLLNTIHAKRTPSLHIATQSVDFKVLHDTETLIGEILVSIIFSESAIDKKVNGVPLSIALA